MKNDDQPALVPKLRFPEFRDAGKWVVKRMDEIADVVASGDLDVKLFSPVRTEQHTFEVYSNSVTQEGLYGFYAISKYEKNSLTITARGTLGIAFSRNQDFMGIGRLLVLSRLKNVDAYFLKESWNYSADIPLENGGIPQLTAMKAKAVVLKIPGPKEQQKIADCLSSLDELIAAQARKVDALKTHKKGLMQQLFPREGEAQPRLRFPEFRDTGEWVPTKIGAIGNFYYGKSAPKWSLEENASTPCVRYGELYTKFGAVITKTYSRTNIDPKNLRFSKGGEILVPRVGEKPEDFGKCCSYLPLANVAIGEMISVFETEQNPLFYTHYFRNLYRRFAAVVEGQNVKNLYYTELEPLAISRPSLDEQKRIADCLTSLDDLITAATQALETLKTHKKGLMQQLFPSAEAVEA